MKLLELFNDQELRCVVCVKYKAVCVECTA